MPNDTTPKTMSSDMSNEKIDWSQDYAKGFENLTGQDYSIPLLIVLQTGSPQLKEGNPQYIESARAGNILSASSGNCYKQCHVIPVRFTYRNVEWIPRNSGGGFVSAYSRNDTPNDLVSDPLTGIMKRPNGNEVKQTNYYLCLLQEENWEQVVIPMTSTQLKYSRKWNSTMNTKRLDDRLLPMYSHAYTLSTILETKSKGSWYSWNIDRGTMIHDLEIVNQARKIYATMIDFLPTRLLTYNTDPDGVDKEEPF